MVPDWNDEFFLQSPYGTIALNDPNGADGYFLLNKDQCGVGPTVRAEVNDVPQSDGSILHNRYLTGVRMQLAIQLWEAEDQPACDTLLTTMHDTLMLHVRSLLRAGDNEGRVLWTPTGQNTRMLDDIRLLEYPVVDNVSNVVSQVTFAVDTGYPYAYDLAEQRISVPEFPGSVVITNGGTAEYWPVFIVEGGTAYFEIHNETLGLVFIYDSSLPGAFSVGGGNIAEVNTFRNTIYEGIGGEPGDDNNLKPGIDVLNSDFWPLLPGNNTVKIIGSDMTVILNNAWG